MGLGESKRRNKLSHDPNNSNWLKSANTYGHKILSAQGWSPGDYLGARDATHSAHYTAASASHIRTLLREENLGLGAQVGKGNAETFGLSVFSGVLGRLNGKSSVEVEKQQNALRDAGLQNYQVMKHGSMNFVAGGLLVGDKITQPEQTIYNRRRSITTNNDARTREVKRKGSRSDTKSSAEDRLDTDKAKEKSKHSMRKSKKRRRQEHEPPFETADSQRKLELESTGNKEYCPESLDSETSVDNAEKDSEPGHRRREQEDEIQDGRLLKAEPDKRALKAQKRARKEERRKQKREDRRREVSLRVETGGITSESDANTAVQPRQDSNRYAVRKRYIDQKRLSSLNPQAMKEIFMLTGAS